MACCFESRQRNDVQYDACWGPSSAHHPSRSLQDAPACSVRRGPPQLSSWCGLFLQRAKRSRFLAQFFNLNYSDYTEIHLLKRETLALINDASTDLSLYESRARGPNIANNAPAAEMSLYASTVPAADASNVSLMGQMAADMQAGDLQRQEEAR